MTGVVAYWRERLQARSLLFNKNLWVRGPNVRADKEEENWPRAVSRAVLLSDYEDWFDKVYLGSYRDVPFFQDNPARLPVPANSLEFFSTMAPFLYIVSRAAQTRSYLIDVREQYQGEWITVKRSRNFVRLGTLEQHHAAYQMQTGQAVGIFMLNPAIAPAETLGNAISVSIRKIAENRATMERSMGKHETP